MAEPAEAAAMQAEAEPPTAPDEAGDDERGSDSEEVRRAAGMRVQCRSAAACAVLRRYAVTVARG